MFSIQIFVQGWYRDYPGIITCTNLSWISLDLCWGSLVFCTLTTFGCDAMHFSVSKACSTIDCSASPLNCVACKFHAFYRGSLSPKWTHMLYLNCDRASWIYSRAVGIFSIKIASKWEEKDYSAVLEIKQKHLF